MKKTTLQDLNHHLEGKLETLCDYYFFEEKKFEPMNEVDLTEDLDDDRNSFIYDTFQMIIKDIHKSLRNSDSNLLRLNPVSGLTGVTQLCPQTFTSFHESVFNCVQEIDQFDENTQFVCVRGKHKGTESLCINGIRCLDIPGDQVSLLIITGV